MPQNTFKIGFGYKARRGKDTAAKAIVRTFGELYNVKLYAFGDELRAEIHGAVEEFCRLHQAGPGEAMKALCKMANVPFDSGAPVSQEYPYGKQRALLQWWGTEYRRAQDPDYWIKLLALRIAREHPDYAVISDMRFMNEFNFCDYRVRMDRPGFEIQDGAHHISEVMLDSVRDCYWDHIITAITAAQVEEHALGMFYTRFHPLQRKLA